MINTATPIDETTANDNASEAAAEPEAQIVFEHLRGHDDEASAYLVADYPYGRKVRTQIRYWVERNKRGGRFVSQTLNPKTGRWNKPKKSTYSAWGAEMYLNEDGHVKHLGLGEYSSIEAFEEMFTLCPQGELATARYVVARKVLLHERLAAGTAYFTIGGVKRERSDAEKEDDRATAARWSQLAARIAQ